MIKRILLTLLEMSSKELTLKTGMKAPFSGLYRCGSDYIALTKGERLPPAKKQEEWTLVVNI